MTVFCLIQLPHLTRVSQASSTLILHLETLHVFFPSGDGFCMLKLRFLAHQFLPL